MKNSIPVLFEAESSCCGCGACYSICSHSAIRMIEDEKGFEYPSIDELKCVRCCFCIMVCPIKRKKKN